MLTTVTAENREQAEILAKYLWFGLIGGPVIEEGVWKSLKHQPGMQVEDVEAVRQMYFAGMKPAVRPEELSALRDRYGIDPKRPATGFRAAREEIFREARSAERSARASVHSLARVPARWLWLCTWIRSRRSRGRSGAVLPERSAAGFYLEPF